MGVVDLPEVRFQGLDTLRVTGGQACGGQLSGQEVISLRARLVAGDGGRPIGPALSRTLTVVAP